MDSAQGYETVKIVIGSCVLYLRSQIVTLKLRCYRVGPPGFRGQWGRRCRGGVGGFVGARDETATSLKERLNFGFRKGEGLAVCALVVDGGGEV
jgi:hypothetical protein